MTEDIKRKFRLGYCLEFALALQKEYQAQGVSVELLGFFKEFEEDGEKYPEVVHAAVGLFIGQEYIAHDVTGLRPPQEVLGDCLFFQASLDEPRYEKMDLEMLECTLGSVVEEAVDEGLNIIRKENSIADGLKLIKNQAVAVSLKAQNKKRLIP